MNDPKQRNKFLQEVAQKGIKAKDRLRVTEQALKATESSDDKKETDTFTHQSELFNEVKIEKFVL